MISAASKFDSDASELKRVYLLVKPLNHIGLDLLSKTVSDLLFIPGIAGNAGKCRRIPIYFHFELGEEAQHPSFTKKGTDTSRENSRKLSPDPIRELGRCYQKCLLSTSELAQA